MIQQIIKSRYFIWAILSIPAIPMTLFLLSGQPSPDGRPVTEALLHPTGEFAARMMIIAMIISPMRLIFSKSAFWMWMMRRRRYFGVAAFGFALAHTIFYLIDLGNLQSILDEFWLLGIWTGWLAFLIFVPLAVTSNDYFVRKLGPTWKKLQQWVYLAAIATLVHWIFVHNNLGPALVHFVPLAGLEAWRIWHLAQRRSPPQTSS